MGRDYTEEEKAFLSQVTASGSGLQKTSTTLSVQDERVQNSCKDNLIFDPTGMEFHSFKYHSSQSYVTSLQCLVDLMKIISDIIYINVVYVISRHWHKIRAFSLRYPYEKYTCGSHVSICGSHVSTCESHVIVPIRHVNHI